MDAESPMNVRRQRLLPPYRRASAKKAGGIGDTMTASRNLGLCLLRRQESVADTLVPCTNKQKNVVGEVV